jgi:hypothetical protein
MNDKQLAEIEALAAGAALDEVAALRAGDPLQPVVSHFMRQRGAGQMHAVVAGAVEWARTAPRGTGPAVVVVGNELQARNARNFVAQYAAPELRERVRVETVAWFERDALGARPAPVLLDSTAVIALGAHGAKYFSAVEARRLRAEAEAGRLRAALRRFAEVFHEGDVCGVCGGAWDDDGRKHFDGCAVGVALTEADQ